MQKKGTEDAVHTGKILQKFFSNVDANNISHRQDLLRLRVSLMLPPNILPAPIETDNASQDQSSSPRT